MSSFRTLALLLLCPVPALLAAQDTPEIHHRDHPADVAELAAITQRGRAIASYDQAAWHATDAVEALHPPKDAVGMYIGRAEPLGWTIAFGKLNPAKDAFLVAFETHPGTDALHPRVVVNTPAREDRDVWFHEALALDLARSHTPVTRPYNATVLPAPSGDWYVYFYPAQTDNSSFPTGADTRYLVSKEGSAIKDTHRMHVSLLENKLDVDKKTAMTYHTGVLDDAPEDTDVADVLMMGGIPMMVVGRNFVYKIEADGTANFLAPTKVLLGSRQK